MPNHEKYQINGHAAKDPSAKKHLLHNDHLDSDTKPAGPRADSLGALHGSRAEDIGGLHGSKAGGVGGRSGLGGSRAQSVSGLHGSRAENVGVAHGGSLAASLGGGVLGIRAQSIAALHGSKAGDLNGNLGGESSPEEGGGKGGGAEELEGGVSVKGSKGRCCRLSDSCKMMLFVLNTSSLVLFFLAMQVYTSGVIRTIERRFSLTSSKTGVVISANDFANIALVVFIGYLGRKSHKPRIIAITMFISCLGGYLMVLPHFIDMSRGADAKDPHQGADQGAEAGVSPFSPSSLERTALAFSQSPLTTLIPGLTPPPRPLAEFCLALASDSLGAAPRGGQCAVNGSEGTMEKEVVHGAFYALVVGQFIGGIGSASMSTLILAYIDENSPGSKSAMYMGIMMSMYAVGPIFGFMTSAATLRLPENLLSTPVDTPEDPTWIGNWWLGYLLYSTVLALASIPLLFYPKHILPPRHSRAPPAPSPASPPKSTLKGGVNGASENGGVKNGGENGGKANGALLKKTVGGKKKGSNRCWEHVKVFPRDLAHLLKNTRYLCLLVAMVCATYIINGVFVNTVRYVEIHFKETAFVASIVAACVSAVSGLLGGFLSGLIVSKLKLTPVGATRMIVITSSVMVTGLIVVLFIRCPQDSLAGTLDPHTLRIDVSNACNARCECDTSRQSFVPVCGADDLTYFSACYAGCTNSQNGTFHNCACVGDNPNPQHSTSTPLLSPATSPETPATLSHSAGLGWARPGRCGEKCAYLAPFAVAIGLISLAMSMSRVPATIVLFRVVDETERSFALSINAFVMNLVGFIPAPILYGTLFDSSCVLWQSTCGRTGSCLAYDTARFRHLNYGVTLGFELLDLIVLITLFCLVRRTIWTESSTAAAEEDEKKVVPVVDEEKKGVPVVELEKKVVPDVRAEAGGKQGSAFSDEGVVRKFDSEGKVVPAEAAEERRLYPELSSVVNESVEEPGDIVATEAPRYYR